jgi:3-methyladenine DNA glycosylase AlkD
MAPRRSLIEALRKELRAAGDPEKASGMKWYMKSEMPYFGVQTPVRRKICKALFTAHPLRSFEEWTETILGLWRQAEYREERYGALELAGAKVYAEYQTLKTLPLYEEMVVTGAWWDYVDDIGSHRLKTLIERYPKGMARRMRSWSKSPNLWKRRCSIICQLRRKLDTDLELLWDCIEVNLDDKEFFIRKAIGWALRDLAWEDLGTVERYVAANRDRLSSLSKREALKNAEKIRASGRQ